ncbi:MAG: sulfurtransferase [Bacteroidetes bacterium]|nr:sulfurtransferase [Bacteroidota bacterium]
MKLFYTIEEIEKLTNERKITLVDVRDKDSFVEGHIPGAGNIPEIFTYLSMSTEEGLQMIVDTFVPKFISAGISNDKPVVFYSDCLSGAYGAVSRGYIISLYLGHKNPGIYSNGLNEWLQLEKKLEFGDVVSEEGKFIPDIFHSVIVTKHDVLKAIDNPKIKLLDDRDQSEWDGESSSPYGIDFAPRKGRIRGSKWIAWHNFMRRDGDTVLFKSPTEIIKLCSEQDISPEDEVIIYCFKGARASNTYMALKTAGFENIKIYFASWNEWSRDLSLPVEE